MDTFLEKYNLPKLNEEEAESLNRPVTPDEIETVIKKLLTHKSPGLDGYAGEFYREFKGGANAHPPQSISKNSRRWKTPQLVLRSQHHPIPKTR